MKMISFENILLSTFILKMFWPKVEDYLIRKVKKNLVKKKESKKNMKKCDKILWNASCTEISTWREIIRW